MDAIKEIKEFCKINGIEDVEGTINKCLIQGFNILKYGYSPQDNFNIENNISNGKTDIGTKEKGKSVEERPIKANDTTKEKESKPVEKEKIPIKTRKIKIIKK